MKRYLFIPIGLLLMIFLFKITCSHYFSSDTAGIAGITKKDSVTYIFIGSSQTRQGLSPQVLEDSLGKAFIVAYNGNSLYFIDYILKTITKNKKPLKIIVEVYPYRALEKVTLTDSRLFLDSPVREKIALLKMLKPNLSPWELYKLIMLEGNESIVMYPLLSRFTNALSYNGGYIGKTVEGVDKKKFNSFKPPYPDTDGYKGLNINQTDALNSIIAYCSQNNLELVFFEPVVPKSIQSSLIYKNAHNDLKSLIQQYGMEYYSSDDYHFDDNPIYFSDPLHLSTLGREIFTKKITRFIK